MRTSSPPGRLGRILASIVFMATLGACGSDDDESGAQSTEQIESQGDDGSTGGSGESTPPAADGYDIPEDYPLPTPSGGTLLSALFDDASGSSNVTIAYPLDSLDGLIQEYDAFFDSVAGETARVPLVDGLASWMNEEAGYSVIVNGQNADVQVRLQTGI